MKNGKTSNVCEKREIRSSLKADVCSCNTKLCNAAPPARDTRLGNWVLMVLSVLVIVVARGN